MKKNIYLDYNRISFRVEAMAQEISEAGFDAIVIVLRGGSFAGMHLAFLTGIPHFFLSYDRSNEAVSWVGNPPSDKKVLLVEDFAGSGKTLIQCKMFLLNLGYEVHTFVVCKDPMSASVPDYHCFEIKTGDARFALPWERTLINGSIFEMISEQKIPDHLYKKTAWRSETFLMDFECFSNIPDGDVVIIDSDKSELKEWTERDYSGISIILANSGDKARMAIEAGCTNFIAVDPVEAIHISLVFPEIRVSWWNEGNLIDIQASSS